MLSFSIFSTSCFSWLKNFFHFVMYLREFSWELCEFFQNTSFEKNTCERLLLTWECYLIILDSQELVSGKDIFSRNLQRGKPAEQIKLSCISENVCIYFRHACIFEDTWIYFWHAYIYIYMLYIYMHIYVYISNIHIFLTCVYFWHHILCIIYV